MNLQLLATFLGFYSHLHASFSSPFQSEDGSIGWYVWPLGGFEAASQLV